MDMEIALPARIRGETPSLLNVEKKTGRGMDMEGGARGELWGRRILIFYL